MNKCVIFDCDGVLVDSEIIAHNMGIKALAQFGCHISVEESIRLFTGVNDKTERKILLEEFGVDIPGQFFNDRQQATVDAFEIELNPLIKNILQVFQDQKIERCVASSSPRNRVLRALTLTNQLSFFHEDSIFTSQQVDKGKPAPDLFLYAAKKMGYFPQDCIVIEDSMAGIEAALTANMTVIGFLGGSHVQYEWYHQKIKNYGIPVVKNEEELLKILQQIHLFD